MILPFLLAASAMTLPLERVFTWREGAVYTVAARPGRVTDIALQPGERLSAEGAVAAGDTVRWIVGDSESGTGAARRVHVLVKPTDPGLETNLVIATDRRTYHLEVRSDARSWMASVAWRYPAGELVALKASPAPAAPPSAEAAPECETPKGPDLARLNFAWRIEGDAPWRPVRVFDDGTKTVIDFPPKVSATDLPPLFVTGTTGAPELVNYRVVGRRIIVDRVFAAGELRIGSGRRQTVVRLVRRGGA